MARKLFGSLILIIGLAACATLTIEEGLQRVKTGMDKDAVLGLAGNPRRTTHSEGKDHWIYTFFKSEREFVRSVAFQNGRVVSVTTQHVLRSPSDEDETPEDLEQFEKKVREEQKANQGQFKDVTDQDVINQ